MFQNKCQNPACKKAQVTKDHGWKKISKKLVGNTNQETSVDGDNLKKKDPK